jgi:hypothetical protein
VAALAAWADEHLDPAIRGEAQDWSATVEDLICILEKRLHELAQELKQCDAVGFTVTFGQTFGSIALTRALKALTPGIKVIFGGTSLADRAGISCLRNTRRSITRFKEKASSRSSICSTP